jgi:hypothetical protein
MERSVWELQVFLKTIGAPVDVDKTFGPITQRLWGQVATSLKLDPLFERVSSTVARVDAGTYAVMRAEYVKRKAPKPAGSNDFEKLNNAIVKMDKLMHGDRDVDLLAVQWQSIASDNLFRSVQSFFLPVQAQSMRDFWERYRSIYNRASTEQQTKMVYPAGIEPGGIASAFTQLWTPAMDTAANVRRQAEEDAAALLQRAGKEIAKGAAEETQKQTYEWVWSLSGLALGGLMVWLYFRPTRPSASARSGSRT